MQLPCIPYQREFTQLVIGKFSVIVVALLMFLLVYCFDSVACLWLFDVVACLMTFDGCFCGYCHCLAQVLPAMVTDSVR